MPREGSGDERARAALARVEAGESLGAIGAALGVSASRVHQLVTKARKLREATISGPKAGKYPCTPDGRYFVVRGRLWRLSNPSLCEAERTRLVQDLMKARRAIADAKHGQNVEAEALARAAVEKAKLALGERGPVWWTDGAPDLNRLMVHTTGYADWYAGLPAALDDTLDEPA